LSSPGTDVDWNVKRENLRVSSSPRVSSSCRNPLPEILMVEKSVDRPLPGQIVHCQDRFAGTRIFPGFILCSYISRVQRDAVGVSTNKCHSKYSFIEHDTNISYSANMFMALFENLTVLQRFSPIPAIFSPQNQALLSPKQHPPGQFHFRIHVRPELERT